MAQSVAAGTNSALWSEEQSLYEELIREEKASAKPEETPQEQPTLPESSAEEAILHKAHARPHPAEPELG